MTEINSNEPNLSLIEFPCAFTIKVFGQTVPEFEPAVLTIIKKYANDVLDENSIKRRDSRDKNYLALSITIQAQSKQQLDNIYQELTKESLVKMAL